VCVCVCVCVCECVNFWIYNVQVYNSFLKVANCVRVVCVCVYAYLFYYKEPFCCRASMCEYLVTIGICVCVCVSVCVCVCAARGDSETSETHSHHQELQIYGGDSSVTAGEPEE